MLPYYLLQQPKRVEWIFRATMSAEQTQYNIIPWAEKL
jgi:hypothetical protein